MSSKEKKLRLELSESDGSGSGVIPVSPSIQLPPDMSSRPGPSIEDKPGSFQNEVPTLSSVQPISVWTATHPLYNHVILQSIFKMLHIEDLKTCRLVCKLWDDLATPPMLSKGVVSVNAEDAESLEELKAWMNSAPWYLCFPGKNKSSLFTNFLCYKITHSSYPNLSEILGPQVRHFTTSHWWNDSRDLLLRDYEHLLLHQCPYLEELNIPSTKNFLIAKDFLVCALEKDNRTFLKLKTLVISGETKPSPKFWRIIKLSPELRTLKLFCQLNEEFWNPFPVRKIWDERMCNLKVLEVKSFGNESITEDSGDYFMSRKWKLETITAEVYIVADVILRVCYERIAKTLQNLNITLFNKHYDPWSVEKIHEGLLSPEMKQIKHWRLGIDDHCSGPVYCRNLFTAISLLNLVSFRMIPYDDECNDDWPNGLFEQMLNDIYVDPEKIPTRPSLTILTLPPKFQDLSCIQKLISIFPNIEELELHTPTPAVVSAIFSTWTQLKRLRITLSDDAGVCWTSVLTGTHSIVDQDCEEDKWIQYPRASLMNLKKLNSVEIFLTSKEGNSPGTEARAMLSPLSDNLIYSGLSQLPVAQNIVVKGHAFSPAAVEALRKAVLMFCHIDISDY